MSAVPSTRVSLLAAIAGSADSARWEEFAKRYRGAMEAYLTSHFPFLEADEIIQETLIALVNVMPGYRYDPENSGHFRNYLTGILRRKALKACARQERRAEALAAYRLESQGGVSAHEREEAEWRHAVFEVALQALMDDESVQERTKQVFVRTAIKGEAPAQVAEAFGLERNAVDQIKARMVAKLKDIIARLGNVDDD